MERERTHYSKFIKNQTEIAELSRVSVAYEYEKASKLVQSSSGGMDELESKRDELKEKSKEMQSAIEKKGKKLKEIIGKKEKDMEGGYRDVEKKVVISN